MLVIKVYVNHEWIDEVHIHNISGGKPGGTHKYRIELPWLPDKIISHKRTKGWMDLAVKALKTIISTNAETRSGDEND